MKQSAGREGEGLCLASIVARMLNVALPPAGSAGVQKRCLWAWHAISQRLSPAHQTQFKLAQAHQAGLTLQHQGDQLLVCLRCRAGWLDTRAELAASSSCSRTVPAGVICWNGDVRRCSAPATGFGPTVMGRRCGVAAGTCTLQRLVTSQFKRCGGVDIGTTWTIAMCRTGFPGQRHGRTGCLAALFLAVVVRRVCSGGRCRRPAGRRSAAALLRHPVHCDVLLLQKASKLDALCCARHWDTRISWVCGWQGAMHACLPLLTCLYHPCREAHGILLFVGFIALEVLCKALKHFLRHPRPSERCAFLDTCDSYGMPSSHTACMAFAAVLRTLLFSRHMHRLSFGTALLGFLEVIALVAATGVVAWSRVYLQYHTFGQTAAGAGTGALFAALWMGLLCVCAPLYSPFCASPLGRAFHFKDTWDVPDILLLERETTAAVTAKLQARRAARAERGMQKATMSTTSAAAKRAAISNRKPSTSTGQPKQPTGKQVKQK